MSNRRLHAVDSADDAAAREGDDAALALDSVDCARVQRAKAERDARKRAERAERTARSVRVTSQILADACHEGHPRRQAGVADALGMSRSRVSKWCDPDEPVSISTHHLHSLSEACPGVYRLYMTRLDQQTKHPTTLDAVPTRARATLAVETLGELLRTEREAMADGVLDERESQALDTLWTKAIDISEAGREALRAARKGNR